MRANKRQARIAALDSTANRLRAYLASMRPLGDSNADDDAYQRGRSLIERMAISSCEDHAPSIRLTAGQCADVLHFIRTSEPIEPRTWWQDPKNAPSHVVGFMFVLWTMQDSLSRRARP
jgi:hypothetical protein